jgi:hypothetical protein
MRLLLSPHPYYDVDTRAGRTCFPPELRRFDPLALNAKGGEVTDRS